MSGVKVFMTALNGTAFLGMVRVDGPPEWASGEGRYVLEADYDALAVKASAEIAKWQNSAIEDQARIRELEAALRAAAEVVGYQNVDYETESRAWQAIKSALGPSSF